VKLAPYPRYKPSGVEWLAEVPEHWKTKPLKIATNFVNGMAFKPETWSTEGTPIIRIENLNGGDNFNCFEGDVPAKYDVQKGDLLFGWSGNRGTSFGPFLWWRDGLHYLNQHIFKLVDFTYDKAWFYWCLKSVTRAIEDEAHGIIGLVHVTRGKLGAIAIPTVPLEEQRAIADFLDRETAKIDSLVTRKRTLIERLKEKRTALISRTVTRGLPPDAATQADLDPHPNLKPSGLDWLGALPEHWGVARFRALLRRLDQGWSPVASSWPAADGEWGVLKLSAARAGAFIPAENKALEEGFDAEGTPTPRAGDLLISRSNTPDRVGDVGLVRRDYPCLLIPDLLYRAQLLQHKALPDFLCWFLLSRGARVQIEADARGSSGSMVKLGQGHIRGWLIPYPPLPEQGAIADFLDRETAKINAIATKIKAAIERLQEYRTALITAAVTGKIDVREMGQPGAAAVSERVTDVVRRAATEGTSSDPDHAGGRA
jgi:type I restriction enzyme S subunit